MSPIAGEITRGLPPQLRGGIQLLAFHVGWTFLLGEVTQNYSAVDRVWTFLTPLYSTLFALYPLLDSAEPRYKLRGVEPRAALMLALQYLWSARLTYNANRRGFFSLKTEDYRWIVFRQIASRYPFTRFVLFVFNLGFIAIAQNILLFSMALPTYAAAATPDKPLHWGDALLTGLILLALATEFTADNQQQAYQTFKAKKLGEKWDPRTQWVGARIEFTEADRRRGFVTKGLWAYSRHPNCACEQSIWFLFCLFPLLTNPSLATNMVDMLTLLAPSLSLSGLFLASTFFTESISSAKYSLYELAYTRRVGMFWPTDTVRKAAWLWIRGWKGEVDSALFGEGLGVDGALSLVQEEEERKKVKAIDDANGMSLRSGKHVE